MKKFDPCNRYNRRSIQSNKDEDTHDSTSSDNDISGYYEIDNYYYLGYFLTPDALKVNVKISRCSDIFDKMVDGYSDCFVQYVYNIKINTTNSIYIYINYYNH